MRLVAFVIAYIFCWLNSSFCQDQSVFFIDKDALVFVDEQADISLKELSLLNDGDFIMESGTVLFSQDSANHPIRIRGKRSTNFDNLTVNLSQTALVLEKNIQVEGSLWMKHGTLDLGDNRLTLGQATGQIVGESDSSYITGSGEIWKAHDIQTGTNTHGNIGLTIQSDHPHVVINIIRKHIVHQTPAGPSINRIFKIQGGNTSLKSSTFQFHFLPHESNGLQATDLRIWQKKGEEWLSRTPSLADNQASYLEFTLAGTGSMKLITLAPPLQARNARAIPHPPTTIKLYPNPTEGSFLIEFEEALSKQSAFLIRNVTGQLIQYGSIPMGVMQHKLSLEQQPAGWYMVTIIGSQERLIQLPVLKKS
ncbi:MAG: T9SS type A sorting domain-containing protein [Bacteroidota bacterium]